MDDRYGTDVLAQGWRDRLTPKVKKIPAEMDLVVEVAADGFCGAVTKANIREVELEDWKGRRRLFPIGHGFMIEGELVELVAPQVRPAGTGGGGHKRSASGSFAVENAKARVARPSRILVEGKHDAELVEKVWGHDLRIEGVVVEFLEGLDNLAELLEIEPPTAERRFGVLVDHLVPGSKETRIVEALMRGPHGKHMKIVGHPYIDVWQAVTPRAMGISAWPVIPRGTDWKTGICIGLGWPHDDHTDIARAWQRILSKVTTFRDLEPSLIGRVEELIDFVTE